jgi:endoglucanase
MVFENYWDSNADYSGLLSNGQNPNAGAAYKAAMAALQAGSPAAAPVGDHTLVLTVSGDSYKGNPHFVVTVDGEQVGGTLTTSAAHALGQTQDITLTGNFGAGAHDVAVKFIDDVYGGSSAADRNLYVHQISLNGQVQAGSTSDNTAGPNSNGVANLWNSGTATFHTGGTDTLVFKVSGDSYQGTPHFLVTVDGQQVGGTLTTSAVHASGQTQDITLTGNFGAGAHDVAVKFIDDAWGGSAATDRNLYVHQVSLNGHIQAGDLADNHAGMNTAGVANLLSNGTADWHM